MRVLLVDDEELSLIELEYILGKFDYIEFIEKALSGFEALKLCRSNEFDVAFLDIRLGDANGISVAQKIMKLKNPPKIVFVTAYDEYAVKAFELQVIDYVLKPFSEERVKKTLERLKIVLENDEIKNENVKRDAKALNKLVVEQGSHISLINIDDIVFIEAAGRNSIVRTGEVEYKSKTSLGELSDRLDNFIFFRPHRSYIINLKKIKEVIPWFNGTYIIKLEGYDHIEIPVTRKNVGRFKEIWRL